MNFLLDSVPRISVLLNLALLVLLVRGYFVEYWLLFLFNLVQPAITIIEMSMNRRSDAFRHVYWTSEVIWDLLLFLLVAFLIERVVQGEKERGKLRRILLFVTLGAVGLPFVLYFDRERFSTPWFQGASQLYNMGAAILNLVLWGAIITTRRRERQLMLVCAGLGINVTGAAIQWGIRQLAYGRTNWVIAQNLADLFAGVTYLLGLVIWCWAFWEPKPAGTRTA